MNKKVIIAIGIVVALCGAMLWQVTSSDKNKQSQTSNEVVIEETPEALETAEPSLMQLEYPALPDNDRFVRETATQTAKRLETGSGVIMLGFKDCPWCQKTVPLLNEAGEGENTPIYYLDILKEREMNSQPYQKIISLLAPYLSKDADGSPRISTPDITIVKNGEIVWRYEMEEHGANERTPETYWTKDRQARAIEDFRDQMQLLKET